MSNTIEKQIHLRAPIQRVWRAISDVKEFGTWFGMKATGEFVAGAHLVGHITIKGYEHVTLDVDVERVEPPHLLAFRWHPGATDQSIDYSKEPKTLVEFRLEEVKDGTRLTVVESGFDALPEWRRDAAFRGNSSGWEGQLKNIERHVTGTP